MTLAGAHDLALVALSIVLAVFVSHTTLDLASRALQQRVDLLCLA
jgi:NO-binding membrane sensor protein with MHYT domain